MTGARDPSEVGRQAALAAPSLGSGVTGETPDAGGAAVTQSADSLPDDQPTLTVVAAQTVEIEEAFRSISALLGECGDLAASLIGSRIERCRALLETVPVDIQNLVWVFTIFPKTKDCKTTAEALQLLAQARASAEQFRDLVGYDMVQNVTAAAEILKGIAAKLRQHPSTP